MAALGALSDADDSRSSANLEPVGTGREPHPDRARPVLARRHPGLPDARRHGRRRQAGARRPREPTIELLGDFTARRAQPLDATSRRCSRASRRGRHQAPDGPDLQPRALDQRLRPVRPLPAHDAAGRLQLAGDRREPGLHRELHRGREQRASASPRASRARALEQILAGEDPDKVLRRYRAPAAAPSKPRAQARPAAGRGKPAAAAPAAEPTGAQQPQPQAPRRARTRRSLDYLLGGGRVSRRRGATAIASNPVLVGVATTLVIVVAVFLAYNANAGPAVGPDLPADGRGAGARPAS